MGLRLGRLGFAISLTALGWVLPAQGDAPEPASTQPAPSALVEGLPEYSAALKFMQSAQEIYVFPNTNPNYPHRDDRHMRLLDAKARAALKGTLDTKEDWWQGLYVLGGDDKPPTDVGFVFKTGKDELVLFFTDDLIASGTLNGEFFKGLLNEGPSQKLKEWAARYAQAELAVPAETPPMTPYRAPANVTVINGITVTGDDLDRMSGSDLHSIFAAFRDAGVSTPDGLLVMNKGEIRGYLQNDEWMTAIQVDCAAADDSQHLCWKVHHHRLPEYSEAMHCIREAKYVHFFTVASPLRHYRDFDHSRMLDDPARRDLAELLGSAISWSEEPASSMPPPGQLSAKFGFELIDGQDQVDLFFSADGKMQGALNGEYLSGALDESATQGLQKWMAKWGHLEMEKSKDR